MFLKMIGSLFKKIIKKEIKMRRSDFANSFLKIIFIATIKFREQPNNIFHNKIKTPKNFGFYFLDSKEINHEEYHRTHLSL